jgi:vacuolar-type H+-ATPase subunit E/Vma4
LPELNDLAGFEEALLEQHKKRCLVLKRSVDEDLADMITARRLEVERIVHNLGRSSEKRLSEGQKALRRRAELQKKAFMIELQDTLLGRLEEKVRARLEAFRRSPRYGDAMNALAAEARKALPSPSVLWVEKGDSVFLKPEGNVLEVREELKDAWGGLVLAEKKEKGKVVDNTFRTRWRRLCPFFVVEHREALTEFFQ